MKITLSLSRFLDMAYEHRATWNFSVPALEAIFAQIEECEEECNTEIEFDPIAIGSSYAEYESLRDMIRDNVSYSPKAGGYSVKSFVKDCWFFKLSNGHYLLSA